jgi:hypothetical protein
VGPCQHKSGVHRQSAFRQANLKLETAANHGESLKNPPISWFLLGVMKILRSSIWLSTTSYDLSYLNFAPRFLVERGRIIVGHSVDLNHCSGI